MAIASIKHKGLRELFVNGRTRRIGAQQHRKLIELLDILYAATDIKDLHGVSGFHALKGNRKGEFSMHVTGNWCLTFKFEDGEAVDVDYEDYH